MNADGLNSFPRFFQRLDLMATLAYYRDYWVFISGEPRRLTFIGYASDGIAYVFMLFNGDLIESARVQGNEPIEENARGA